MATTAKDAKAKTGTNGASDAKTEPQPTRTFTEHTAKSATDASVEAASADESGNERGEEFDPTTGAKAVRKVSPQTIFDYIGGASAKDLVSKGTLKLPMDIFIVLGRSWNILTDFSDFGEWNALIGEFEAQSLIKLGEVEVTENGKTTKEKRILPCAFGEGASFVSTKCFIPGPAGDRMVAGVKGILTGIDPNGAEIPPKEIAIDSPSKRRKTFENGTGEYIEIGCIIRMLPSKRAGGAPYEYDVVPLQALAKTNLLDNLRAKITGMYLKHQQQLALTAK